jgi:hypothetical protein
MKKCNKCLIEKDMSDFHRNNSSKDGYKNICRSCFSIQNKKYKKEYNKKYKSENKEKIKEYNNQYELNNKEKRKEWRLKNKNKLKENRKIYEAERRKDPIYRFKKNIRNLIYKSIIRMDYSKKSKSYDILGCTPDEFRIFIESKFESWMTWEKYGRYNGELNYGWDIDHIIPLISAKTEEELIILNHYTNLQPLCSKINRDIKYRNKD